MGSTIIVIIIISNNKIHMTYSALLFVVILYVWIHYTVCAVHPPISQKIIGILGIILYPWTKYYTHLINYQTPLSIGLLVVENSTGYLKVMYKKAQTVWYGSSSGLHFKVVQNYVIEVFLDFKALNISNFITFDKSVTLFSANYAFLTCSGAYV